NAGLCAFGAWVWAVAPEQGGSGGWFVARMERSEIRGSFRAMRPPRVTLRSTRATVLPIQHFKQHTNEIGPCLDLGAGVCPSSSLFSVEIGVRVEFFGGIVYGLAAMSMVRLIPRTMFRWHGSGATFLRISPCT